VATKASAKKFKGATTFNTDYKGIQLKQSAPLARPPHKKNPAKFGNSSYKTQFTGESGREMNAVGNEGPTTQTITRRLKFDSSTSYRDEYLKKDLPKPEKLE
jgi:hypothetical protein